MSGVRASSSLGELALAPTTSQQQQQQYDDSALQGVAANLKLLLKLIQEHKDACYKEKNDHRRMLRVATMMTILDTVRARIQKCQSFGNKRSKAELQRCNTDLSPKHTPMDKRHSGELVILDEKEKLRRELNASLAARKSLQIMCSSLGKEKEIMAAELSRKVQELNGMDELINDLKAQNEMLLEKVRECALQHSDRKCFGGFGGGGGGEESQRKNAALQEQNKALSERLSKALDRYRLMKWKLKEAQEENMMMRSTVDEMGSKVMTSLKRVRSFKEHMSLCSGSGGNMGNFREEIVALESMFESFTMLVMRYDQRQGERGKFKGKISACMPSVLTREEEVT
ncbi:hypothetical protein CDL12_24395 [Handroanthus impetiginosus]|uniref:Uncharacterized protein n=1 Tax=Handroanthus impetiginosus TaxID=429701 RepID=A0A2G9GCR5_9LAMI|nr:hypothetical protein CDL12_24395 [Handroanthus impetiginosus]